MKKLRKVALVCTFVFVVMAVVGSVYGVNGDANALENALGNQTSYATSLNTTVGNVWGTVSTIIQVLAVAAVVFAGVRYMFASADAKADIKKQTVILIVGAVLVFGATAILGLVSSTTGSLIK